jgi:DNA processing protein
MNAARFELRLGSRDYPEQLASCPAAPRVLYGIGDPGCLSVGLGVVGARKATPYGLASTKLFAGWAAQAGYVVISGAANGCDRAAHEAALEVEGITVAVLPGGADVTYPSTARDLLHRIAASGACVSEHPWGTAPKRWTFRTRNRIIAGLSGAVLVIEGRLPSGTFSTADYAVDAGREVFAVPGSIHSPESRGPNRLLRQGATPITDVDDLAHELRACLGEPAGHAGSGNQTIEHDGDAVLATIKACPSRPDDVAFALGMDIVRVSRRIGTLEAMGRIARMRDGRYASTG